MGEQEPAEYMREPPPPRGRKKRGKPVPREVRYPPLTVEQILEWADAHHARRGKWPSSSSGPVEDAPGETWVAIEGALRDGCRGLPGGSSVARLLQERRGRRNHMALPRLTVEQIVEWADAHRARTGRWPSSSSGPVADALDETWNGINAALSVGARGFPGGWSLPRLLHERRGRPHRMAFPPLTVEQILAWADAHRQRTGRWPTTNSGPLTEAPDERWSALDGALRDGRRGLPPGSSLRRLLAERRGVPNYAARTALSEEQILAWADAYYAWTGRWPSAISGRVADAPGESWKGIDRALRDGRRKFPGGSSLARLLDAHRGAMRGRLRRPALSEAQVLAWADAHHERTGGWPTGGSGPVEDAPDETWNAIEAALRGGNRGLPGGSSLPRLLQECRGRRNHRALPPLTVEQILTWADAHRARTGQWPTRDSGRVQDAPGEGWNAIEGALRRGYRGLPGGWSVARLLAKEKNRP
jgi:hypothetical protein